MEKLLTRAKLYELVWARPATKVAAELGISGVALGKICRRHKIPVPGRGHWAKLAAGKSAQTVRLPTVTEPRLEEILIVGSAMQRLPVPVQAAREQAIALAAESVSHHDADSSPVFSPEFNRHDGKLRCAKARNDGFLHLEGSQCFPVTIAPGSLERALVALNRIITEIQARGYRLKSTETGLVIDIGGETVSLALFETTKKEPHLATPAETARVERWETAYKRKTMRGQCASMYDKPQIPEHDTGPSGQLVIEIDRGAGSDGVRRRFADGKQQRIETMAETIVTTAAVCAAAAIERREEAARQKRKWEEWERQRNENERRQTLEKKRWEFLEAKMQRFERARHLQRFVSDYKQAFSESSLLESCQLLLEWTEGWVDLLLEEVSPVNLAKTLDKFQLMDDSTSINSWTPVTG